MDNSWIDMNLFYPPEGIALSMMLKYNDASIISIKEPRIVKDNWVYNLHGASTGSINSYSKWKIYEG